MHKRGAERALATTTTTTRNYVNTHACANTRVEGVAALGRMPFSLTLVLDDTRHATLQCWPSQRQG